MKKSARGGQSSGRDTADRSSGGDAESQAIIGLYVDTYLPALDGVIMTVQNYAQWLHREHFPCFVAAASPPAGYKDEAEYPIYRYASIPMTRRPPYRYGIPVLDRRFVQSAYDLKPALVHTHSPFLAGNEALRIARRQNIPIVATFHSKYYDDVLQSTGSRYVAEKAVDLIVRFYNNCDQVWTVNEATAQTLRSYGYQKELTIMPNGTDFQPLQNPEQSRLAVGERYGIGADERLLLFVGQHILQKNLTMLIEAVSKVERSGSRFKLLMVGDGYARPALEQMARELGLTEDVIFAGLVSDRKLLSAIYTRADLFVFPSIYDNAPLVVREAAAAGCPSVLVAGSNAAEGATDGFNAYLCENSVESLAMTIRHALSDDQARQEIGRSAAQTMVRSWQQIVREVASQYHQILAEYQPRQKKRLRLKLP